MRNNTDEFSFVLFDILLFLKEKTHFKVPIWHFGAQIWHFGIGVKNFILKFLPSLYQVFIHFFTVRRKNTAPKYQIDTLELLRDTLGFANP